MTDLLLKSINPDTRIGVSNRKYGADKATLAKFGKNVKYYLDDISSNYFIIIDNEERQNYYIRHIFRAVFSGQNSTFNILLKGLRMIGTQEQNPQKDNSFITLLISTMTWHQQKNVPRQAPRMIKLLN